MPDDQAIPGLYQMAAGGAQGGGGQDWAPSWVKEELPTNLAYWSAQNEGADPSGAFASLGASGVGKLAPWLNPENWGAPPAVTGPMPATEGWFPREFTGGGSDPNDKFWSQKSLLQAYNQQYPGGQAGIDERPNTRNRRMFGSGSPVDFMVMGHPIGQSKLYYDLHRPVSDPMTAGSLLPARNRFGRDASAWSTTGEVGFPGQLDPFGVSWGAGGP